MWDAPKLPMAASDRGTQMTSKSTQQFFFDLGIVQSFSRPKTPTDNATCESWIATLKCERLHDANTADMAPWEVESLIDHFIDHPHNDNRQRLHSSLDYMSPLEFEEERRATLEVTQ